MHSTLFNEIHVYKITHHFDADVYSENICI